MAHDDGLVGKIDALQTQLQGLVDSHAGAVEQASKQSMLALQPGHDGGDLLKAEHDRQSGLYVRTADVLQPWDIEPKDLVVQEQQGGERLPVRGRCNRAGVGQPRQIGLDVRCAQIARMLQSMELDEAANPIDVDILGSVAEMQVANPLTDLLQQFDRLQGREVQSHLWSGCRRCNSTDDEWRLHSDGHRPLRAAQTHPHRAESEYKVLIADAPLLPACEYCINARGIHLAPVESQTLDAYPVILPLLRRLG